MSSANGEREDLYRPLKAIAVVLAILVAIPGVDVVMKQVTHPQRAIAANAVESGIDASRYLDTRDAFGSLDRLETAFEASAREVPTSILREAVVLPSARDVRVTPTGDVVGYTVEGDSVMILSEITSRMKEIGWTAIPLNETQGATFVKKSGELTWLLVTCTQVEASTSVVMRGALP